MPIDPSRVVITRTRGRSPHMRGTGPGMMRTPKTDGTEAYMLPGLENLGSVLRETRVARAIPQRILADTAGMPVSVLSLVEQGSRRLTPRMYTLLCQTLDLPPEVPILITLAVGPDWPGLRTIQKQLVKKYIAAGLAVETMASHPVRRKHPNKPRNEFY